MPLRRSRLAVSVAYASQGVCFAALVTRIPALKDRFSLSEAGLAGLLVLVPVIAGVGSIAAGALAARWGSRRLLRLLGPLVPVTLVGVGASGSLPGLAILLVVLGFGLGSVDASMNMQGVAVQSGYGRPLLGSFYAVFSLAGIVGAVLAAVAAGAGVSLMLFFGLLALVIVPVQLTVGRWLRRGVDALEGDTAAMDLAADVAERRVPWRPVLLIGVVLTAVYIADSAASNWSAVYLTDGLGSSEAVAALAYACYALATLLARTMVDRGVTALGPVRLVRLGGVLAIVGVLAVVLAPQPAWALAAFAVLGLGVAPVIPLAFTAAASHDRAGSGVAVARVNVFNYAGFVLGAPLVGLVAEATSLRVGFAVLMPVLLVVPLLAPAFLPRPAHP